MSSHHIFLISTISALALAACGSQSGPASDSAGADNAPEPAASSGGSAALGQSTGATRGETMQIVGSSTVYPFTTAVAEQFGAKTAYSTPIVESTGTGGGMKLFCAGVGSSTPDFTDASRRIKTSEYEMCQQNGVTGIMEIPVGYDGIVIANAKTSPSMNITLKQLFTALAKEIPASETNCTLQANPYSNWSEINSSLPDEPIEVYGPPPTSGTRDAFVELGMAKGAAGYDCLAELEDADGDAFEAIAFTLREDQRWIDSGENDNAIVQTLTKTPTAFGVFGYSFLEQNNDRLQGAVVEGVSPEFELISSGEYPISRTLFIYAKAQHAELVPGFQEFINEYTSEDAMGDFGYLAEKGLIPLPDGRVAEVRAAARSLQPLDGAPTE